MTWPTKDDDCTSSNDPQPTQSQQMSTSLDEADEDDEESLKPEPFDDDEPEMCLPLRMILVPTEEELNSSQMTPSSSFKSFSLQANYPDLKDLNNMKQMPATPFKSDFNANGSRAALDKQQQQLHPTAVAVGFDTEKQSNDPKWAAADPDFNYSFDMPDSLPSPPNSPGFQRQRLQP